MWDDIDFSGDREGCLFTATVQRKAEQISPTGSPKTENLILELLREDPHLSAKTIGISKRAVLKQISKLKDRGFLRRIGSAKGGHWEVNK